MSKRGVGQLRGEGIPTTDLRVPENKEFWISKTFICRRKGNIYSFNLKSGIAKWGKPLTYDRDLKEWTETHGTSKATLRALLKHFFTSAAGKRSINLY